MSIDYNKKYFLMSFRFDKTKPEDFGLTQSPNDNNVFIDKSDNSEWVKKKLYDFGWGDEAGFVRLPELNSSELWKLMVNSQLRENKFGAACLLENEYSDDLLLYLLNIPNNQNKKATESTKEIFRILKLDSIRNRSKVVGKSLDEINKDYENWRLLGTRASEILK